MAAVDLSEYAEAMAAVVNAPGENFFPSATEETWTQALVNAFWDGYLNGHFRGFNESEGIIDTVPTGGTAFPRDQVQLVMLYAAHTAVRNKLLSLKTALRAKAGPTEFETQRSAQVLTAILKDISTRLTELKKELVKRPRTSTFIFDAIEASTSSLLAGDSHWVG